MYSLLTPKRERTLLAFSKKDIFDFGYGLLDLGTIAKAFSVVTEGGGDHNLSSFRHIDAENLGVKLMQKTLHLDDVQRQYNPEEKRKFYSEMIGKEGSTMSSEIDVPNFGRMYGTE